MYTWRPKGKYVIRFCESPPCHILESDDLLEFTSAELGVPLNHTTKDGLFTLEKTACLGVCEVAPAMQINEVVHGNLTKDKIKQILADYQAGKAPTIRNCLIPLTTSAAISRARRNWCCWITSASSIQKRWMITWPEADTAP